MSIARTTILLLFLTLLTRALGLLREMVVAWRYGASADTDAFFLAFTIPWAFYSIVGGSLTGVIIPLLAGYEAKGQHEEASHAASLVINTVLLSMGALAVVGMIGAPQIALFLGGGFDETTLQRAAQFTAWMMPSIIFMSLAGVLAGILNYRHVFGPPAFGPVAMNVLIILSATAGGAWVGIEGLVVGVLLGAISFMAVQLPALRRTGFRHRWTVSLKDPVVRRIAGMLWPVMLVSGLGFTYTVIDFRLASSLTEGSVTALNYALKLIQLPQAMFVMAVSTAIFPSLSKHAANAEQEELASLLRKGLRIILFFAVPGTVGLMIIGQPLIELLFQRGAFGLEATAKTSSAMFFLSLGLIGFCMNMPLIRSFYALNDRCTPLLVSLIFVIIKIVLSLILVKSMQHSGLALATSITILLNAFILAFILMQKIPNIFNIEFLIFMRNVLIGSIIMGLGISEFNNAISKFYQNYHFPAIILTINVIIGAILYSTVVLFFRVEEIRSIFKHILNYIQKIFKMY